MGRVKIDNQGRLGHCGCRTTLEQLRLEIGDYAVYLSHTTNGLAGTVIEHWRIYVDDGTLHVRRIRSATGDVWHEYEEAEVVVPVD